MSEPAPKVVKDLIFDFLNEEQIKDRRNKRYKELEFEKICGLKSLKQIINDYVGYNNSNKFGLKLSIKTVFGKCVYIIKLYETDKLIYVTNNKLLSNNYIFYFFVFFLFFLS